MVNTDDKKGSVMKNYYGDVKIPVPIDVDFDHTDKFGRIDTVKYTVKTISRQAYDAKLVKDWYEQHKHADVQVVSQDTKMPLYAIYGTPLAYYDEEQKLFWAKIREISEVNNWEEDYL